MNGQQYNFRNYSVREGVAQSQVYSLLQDSRGWLWMGTVGGGLTRFDGISFKTFSTSDGLVDNYINYICEDSRHILWICTVNGLSSYNGISFTSFHPAGDSVACSITCMDFDISGRAWLATSTGIYMYEQKHFKDIFAISGEKRAAVNCILADKKGNIWYGTAEGIFMLRASGSGWSVLKPSKQGGFKTNYITCLKEDKEGKIWFGTYGDGAWVTDGNKCFRATKDSILNRQTVWDIFQLTGGHTWFATMSHGFAEYDPGTGKLSWITEKEGLSNNNVRCIMQDRSGNLWFGTSGGGVCNYLGKQFTTYDQSSGLGGNFIYQIFRDSRQRLWISTSGKGVTVLDSGRFTVFNASSGFRDLKVKAIAEDDSGNIYLGTEGEGVFRYNGKELTVFAGLSGIYVRALLKDKNGSLWIATSGDGLFHVLGLHEKTFVQRLTTTNGLMSNRLSCLHMDKQGRLWYGTENNGIGCLEKGRPSGKTFNRRNGLPSDAIRCMTEDESGYLWVGTAGSGLVSFPLYSQNIKFSTYNKTNGLASSNIYLLITDTRNNLFVGSETGLDYIILDPSRKPSGIRHYSRTEGFSGVETCQNSVWKDNDGTLWFGTINGLSHFSQGSFSKNKYPPVTTITDVKLFYESLSSTKFRNFTGDWNSVSNLELPAGQNHLTFEFMAINLSNPSAVKYRWKLDGFDNNWSPVSREHSIVYSNLNPGTYTFKVIACNEDGMWNPEPVKLTFSIAAPYWQKSWFLVLCAFAGLALVVLLFRLRISRVKAKERKERQKLEIEKSLVELEQKALRLQMNPHFIFNALNSIQSLIGNNQEQQARYYLAKFSRLMRQILDNSRNATITLEEEISLLENYLLVEKFCNGGRFDYSITVNPDVEKDFIRIPPMLLQPFVENSIKHGFRFRHSETEAGPSRRGKIEIEFIEKDNVLECILTDNGIGRVKAEELKNAGNDTHHNSTAMSVTKQRLEMMKKVKGFEPLEVTDLYDEKGNALGTKVIVRILLD